MMYFNNITANHQPVQKERHVKKSKEKYNKPER